MKIIVLGALPRSLINFRGRLIEAMIAAGHEVIGCAAGEAPEVAGALAERGASYVPVPLERTGLNPLRDLATVAALVRVFRRLKPDLLLAYAAKPVIYGMTAARFTAIPHRFALITGLGYAFADGREWQRRVLRRLNTHLYRIALRFADAVFFQNRDDLDDAVKLKFTRPGQTLVQVNGSGVDLGHYAFAAPSDGPVDFLMTARLVRDKGVIEYVEAARRLRARFPTSGFRLLGRIGPEPGSIGLAELQRWRAEADIEYLGTTDDVRPHLRDCAVFVLPSCYREGMPRTILEAMATGRAIITTDTPGCRETVVPGENGLLVPPRDPAALAAAMERFILDPRLAVAMGRRSRVLAEERFDVRKVNAVMLEAMGLR